MTMKVVMTIETRDAESERRLKEWLSTHHGDAPVAVALRDEIRSLLEADSGAEVVVEVEVAEE